MEFSDSLLILTPEIQKYELFAIKDDPTDENDLYDPKDLPADVKKLVRELNAAAIDILRNKPESKIDKQTEEMLKALGYVK